jgi:transketolase
MRNKFAEVLYKLSKTNNKIRVVAADISPEGKLAELSKKYPDRFINVGVAESSMISMCAGLAMRGLTPFAYTIASFSIFRPFEMVRIDVGYQNLPVVIVGMGAGTVYSTLGGTHLTQEDVSVIRCLPNFKILNPCDPLELEECLKWLCTKNVSPCYLRIGKSGEQNFTENSYEKWKYNSPRVLVKGVSDLCLIGTGPIIKFFFNIIKNLEKNKIYPTIISYHTLKPENNKEINKIFKRYKNIFTLEDISEINGLSSIFKIKAFEENYKGKLTSYALKDKNIKNYGSQKDLLKSHGITESKIYKSILRTLKTK